MNEPPAGRHARTNAHLAGKRLARREAQCLALIAEALGTTSPTVKGYVQRLLRKLEANDRAHAVAIAARAGILDLSGIDLDGAA